MWVFNLSRAWCIALRGQFLSKPADAVSSWASGVGWSAYQKIADCPLQEQSPHSAVNCYDLGRSTWGPMAQTSKLCGRLFKYSCGPAKQTEHYRASLLCEAALHG